MNLVDPNGLSGGRLDWAAARQALVGASCLWQDLDGLHLAPPPKLAPPTSILWAWWDESEQVARLRMDGETCYLAVAQMPANSTVTVPWPSEDGRIAHYDGAKPQAPRVDLQFETGVLPSPDPATGYADLTFIRPTRKDT